MPNLLTLKNWYQIDFKIDSSAKTTLQSVGQFIDELKTEDLINRWFYLFENTTIRIRFSSTKPTDLESAIPKFVKKFGLVGVPEKPFEPYTEDTNMFASPAMVETFANVMSELSELTIQRFEDKTRFSNYKLVERLSHCIYNNVYGSDTEIYFLLKKLGIDFKSQDNPEQTILDDNQKYLKGCKVTFTTPPFYLPKK